VTASDDNSIWVWQAKTGKPIRELRTRDRLRNELFVLNDGLTFVSSNLDDGLLIREIGTGKNLRAIKEPGYGPVRAAVAADCTKAATLSMTWGGGQARDFLLHVWDLSTGKVLLRRPLESAGSVTGVRLFSPDLKTYLGHASRMPNPGPANPLAKLPHGTDVALIKDIATGQTLVVLPQPDHAWKAGAFSPDGRTLVTSTFRPGLTNENNDGYALHFRELSSGQERLTLKFPERGDRHAIERIVFAPDGLKLVTLRWNGMIQLWSATTGKELLRHDSCQAQPTSTAFAPDGKSLAVGYADSTILVWDLACDNAAAGSSHDPTTRDLDAWWADLASTDASKAYSAIWMLVATPHQSVPYLRSHVAPAAALPQEKLRALINDLDHAKFSQRESAARDLADLEERAFPALEEALRANPSPEKRKRIESLLAAQRIVRSPDRLRELRAVEVLEHIGTPEAKAVVETITRGASESRLTQDAKATLERMRRKTLDR